MSPLLLALSIMAVIQAWIYAVLFLVNGRKRGSNYLLALFLFIYTASYIPWIIEALDTANKYHDIQYIPTGFFFLIAPVFYLYAKKVVGLFSRRDLMHLIPGVVELIVLMVLFFSGDHTIKSLYAAGHPLVKILYSVVWPVYSISYLFLTIWLVTSSDALISQVYTHTINKKLQWIQYTAMILVFDYLTELHVANTSGYGVGTRAVNTYELIVIDLFIVYWICLSGYRQEELRLTRTVQPQLSPVKQQEDEERVIFREIERSVMEKRLYCNKELTLYMLAEQVGHNYKLVSRVINQHSGMNFSQYINQFRVEEAKKLLVDEDHSHRNLNGIADLVGFYSRSTFFNTFKQVEGCTPAEYKKLKMKSV